jgi:hypothetical protein
MLPRTILLSHVSQRERRKHTPQKIKVNSMWQNFKYEKVHIFNAAYSNNTIYRIRFWPHLKLIKIIYILTAHFSQRVLIVSFQVP